MRLALALATGLATAILVTWSTPVSAYTCQNGFTPAGGGCLSTGLPVTPGVACQLRITYYFNYPSGSRVYDLGVSNASCADFKTRILKIDEGENRARLLNGETAIPAIRDAKAPLTPFATEKVLTALKQFSSEISPYSNSFGYQVEALYNPNVTSFQEPPPSTCRPAIAQMYRDVLGREADQGGLAGWTDACDNGLSLRRIEGAFVGSAEMTAKPTYGYWEGNGPQSYHPVGQANGSRWEFGATGQYNVLTYGPYQTGIPAGHRVAIFKLATDYIGDGTNIIDIDVYRNSTGTVLARRTIQRNQFDNTFSVENFALPFEYDGQGELEFRVFVHGWSYVLHHATEVK